MSKAVRTMFQRIERCNGDSIAATGDIDVQKIAALLTAALEDPRSRSAIVLGIAEFIGGAMDGAVPDP